MILWGGMVLWLSLSKQLSSYLHPSLQPYTTSAGILLLLLSFFRIRSLMLLPKPHHHGTCCGHSHHGEPSHDHGDHDHHHQESPRGKTLLLISKTILLLLPLVIFVSGNATAYTVTTVQNRGVVDDLSKLPAANANTASSTTSFTAASTAQGSAKPSSTSSPGGPMPLQIIDMLYAIQMPSYREEFEGKEVEMVGQFVPMITGNPKGDRFQAIRLFITCCAADAKPVGVTVRYPKAVTVSEMGWVKITGKPTFPMEGGRQTAVLEADSVKPCDAPSEPFVY